MQAQLLAQACTYKAPAPAQDTAHLALLRNVGQVVAEAAQQTPVALVAQVVKADALLLAVELHDGVDVVGVLALVATCAQAFCEVEADLWVAATAVAGHRRILRYAVLQAIRCAHTVSSVRSSAQAQMISRNIQQGPPQAWKPAAGPNVNRIASGKGI